VGAFAVSARGVRFAYAPGQDVLRGVDIEIGAGESVAVLGRNGAGKTTLMNLFAGLARPTGGDVELFDGTVTAERLGRFDVGYVSQERALFPSLRPRENLEYFGALAGVERAGLNAAVDQVVDALELGAVLDRPVKELSGGMAQRLHIACGVIGGPRLLLLDEPTVSVDVDSRLRIYEVIRAHVRAGGTLVLTTHLLEECERLCERAYFLSGGVIAAAGTLSELTHDFSRPRVRLDTAMRPARVERMLTRAFGPEVIRGATALGGWVSVEHTAAVSGEDIVRHLREARARFRSYEISKGTLEDALLEVTGSGANGGRR
jgi:ABC-2 type transport system ATP-binding protein